MPIDHTNIVKKLNMQAENERIDEMERASGALFWIFWGVLAFYLMWVQK
jgi:hypothetical protein